jgi:hypothetical protein
MKAPLQQRGERRNDLVTWWECAVLHQKLPELVEVPTSIRTVQDSVSDRHGPAAHACQRHSAGQAQIVQHQAR